MDGRQCNIYLHWQNSVLSRGRLVRLGILNLGVHQQVWLGDVTLQLVNNRARQLGVDLGRGWQLGQLLLVDGGGLLKDGRRGRVRAGGFILLK